MIRKQVFPLIFRACVPNLPVYISRHSKMTVLWSFAFSLFSKQIFQVMASRRDPGGPRKLLETIREKQVRWSNVKRQFSLQVCTTRCKNVIHLNSRMSRSKYNLPVLIQAWQDISPVFLRFHELLALSYTGSIFNFFENIFSRVCDSLKISYFVTTPNHTSAYPWGSQADSHIRTVERLIGGQLSFYRQ